MIKPLALLKTLANIDLMAHHEGILPDDRRVSQATRRASRPTPALLCDRRVESHGQLMPRTASTYASSNSAWKLPVACTLCF